MKCKACDEILTNRESVRRVASTGEFLDLCNRCYETIQDDVPTTNRFEIEDEGEPENEPASNPRD